MLRSIIASHNNPTNWIQVSRSGSFNVGYIIARRTLAVSMFFCAFQLLSGCTTVVALRDSDDPPVVNGKLTINMTGPHFIDLELDSRPYHGEWRSIPLQVAALNEIADKTSRRYYSIFSGLETSPIREVSAVLFSPETAPLKCEWIDRRGHIAGSCWTSDGRNWKLAVS